MTDYTRVVGNAGTMIIRDNGTTVEYLIACSDGATTVGSYTWSGVVNGAGVGGTVALGAGFGTRSLGSWTVGSSQTVTFHQNATGTSGLGGAADLSANIVRSTATVPPAPTPVGIDLITTTSMRYRFYGNGDGGSPITLWTVQVDDDPAFGSPVSMFPTPDGYATATGLTPGVLYSWRASGSNALGMGAWSPVISARTLGGVYVSDGAAWKPGELAVSDGAALKPATVSVSDGTTWRPTA